jgi:uncharacterized membrane protein
MWQLDPQCASALMVFYSIFWLRSAWPKWQESLRFSGVIDAYRLIPIKLSLVATYVLGSLELIVALGLWFAATRIVACCIALVLLSVYAIAIGIQLNRGQTEIDCGCGGLQQKQPIRPWMLIRHLCLGLGVLLMMSPWTDRDWQWADNLFALFEGLTLYLLYGIVETLLTPYQLSSKVQSPLP